MGWSEAGHLISFQACDLGNPHPLARNAIRCNSPRPAFILIAVLLITSLSTTGGSQHGRPVAHGGTPQGHTTHGNATTAANLPRGVSGGGTGPAMEQLHLQRGEPIGEGADVVVDRTQRPVQDAAHAFPGVGGDQRATEGGGFTNQGDGGGIELPTGRGTAAGTGGRLGRGRALLGGGGALDEVDEEMTRQVESFVLAPVLGKWIDRTCDYWWCEMDYIGMYKQVLDSNHISKRCTKSST